MDVKNKSIPELLFKMAPPVMLALLIQSIYNIADSFFVARYSTEGLTALSIIYPIQLLITALATGTGAGVNILISRLDGSGEKEVQQDIIKSGLILNFIYFLIFAFAGNLLAYITKYSRSFLSRYLVSSRYYCRCSVIIMERVMIGGIKKS